MGQVEEKADLTGQAETQRHREQQVSASSVYPDLLSSEGFCALRIQVPEF